MVVLKPKGRGNWKTSTLHIEGAHQLPLLVAVGQEITIGGVVFRICGVKP
ncbi:MAG: hypothetical protein HXX19_11830 [Rhodoferax sp.]|nr:hypothetical protein [Rhodoferax sp.]